MTKTHDLIVGVGFYKREQWPLLLEAAADSYRIERTYDEWLEVLATSIEKIRAQGIEPLLVEIDIDELSAFCAQRGLQNTGSSRSLFITERARKKA